MARLIDDAGITRFEGRIENGGSQAGALRMLGPVTVGFADVIADAGGFGWFPLIDLPAGALLVGWSHTVSEAFDDTSPPSGGNVAVLPVGAAFPGDSGDTYASVNSAPINLTIATLDSVGYPGYQAGEYGLPNLSTASGNNPRNVFGSAYSIGDTSSGSAALPWRSDGKRIALLLNFWAADGTAGSADFYFLVATPVAP